MEGRKSWKKSLFIGPAPKKVWFVCHRPHFFDLSNNIIASKNLDHSFSIAPLLRSLISASWPASPLHLLSPTTAPMTWGSLQRSTIATLRLPLRSFTSSWIVLFVSCLFYVQGEKWRRYSAHGSKHGSMEIDDAKGHKASQRDYVALGHICEGKGNCEKGAETKGMESFAGTHSASPKQWWKILWCKSIVFALLVGYDEKHGLVELSMNRLHEGTAAISGEEKLSSVISKQID